MTIEIIPGIVFPIEKDPHHPESIAATLAQCGRGDGFILKVAEGESCNPLIARVRRAAAKCSRSVTFYWDRAKGDLYIRESGPLKRRLAANSAQRDLTLTEGAN